MLSRVLGFVRDLIFARIFGADAATDAFFVAFKIPNFMRRLFAEGAFAAAFVPVLTEYKTKRSFAELKRFVDDMAGSFGLVLFIVTVIGVLAAPFLVMIFAPGFIGQEGKSALATEMLRLTFPYLLFISLTAFAGGILNAHNRFSVPAFTPVLLNLCLIGCALWLAPTMDEPIVALAWGVLMAGMIQLAFQLPFLGQIKLLPRPRIAFADKGIRKVLKLMAPALFGVSVSQINLLLDTLIASFLVSGSISWLYYSDRLMEFPVGILGVALGTVILPNLSRKHAEESTEAFSHTLDWGLRLVLLLGVPSCVGLILLSGPMLVTLFHSEAFNEQDVLMSSYSLIAYAFALIPFIAIKVLAPGYYARQNTKTPVKIGIIAMTTNMVLNLIFVFPLDHAGLALATSISASLNAWLLLQGLRKDGTYRPEPHWFALIGKVLCAALAMGLLLFFGTAPLTEWMMMSGLTQVGQLLGWITSGALLYFIILYLLGIRKQHFLTR